MNIQTRLKQNHGVENSPKRFTAKQPTPNVKHRKANKSKSKRTLPSSLPFVRHIKNLRISLQKAGKSRKKEKEKKRSRTSLKPYKKPRKPKPFFLHHSKLATLS
jgi:hypothetical protein